MSNNNTFHLKNRELSKQAKNCYHYEGGTE